MASLEKMNVLRSFLGSLPAGLAQGLARAVEVDRMNNGTGLPHDEILESLRPTLRESDRNARALTPLRLFCRPFEDLLTDEPRRQKQKGRIARSSITPVWNWLSQDLVAEQTKSFALAVKTAALGHGTDEILACAIEFWQTASQVLSNKLASDSGRRAAERALNSDAVVADAREMALMLGVGPEVYAFQEGLPQSIPSLTEDAVQAFRVTYERLLQTAPAAAAYLPFVVMKRLEHPWEALRLPLGAGGAENHSTAGSDAGLVGEVLFGAIEAHGAAIRAAMPHRFNADALLLDLNNFTTLSNGVVKEVEHRSDGVWSQRLIKDRAAVADVMDGFMLRAPEEIGAALPMLATDGEAGSQVPDISRPADPEKSDRALCYARLVAGCRPLAAQASFGASLKRADDDVMQILKRYNDAIVRELRDTPEELRVNAEQYAALATELTAILLSAEEGETLRQSGREAAIGSMAA
jgi:hypothetical protein